MKPTRLTAAALIALLCAATTHAQPLSKVFPETPDPFVGDYIGRWLDDATVDPTLAAQVIALGNNRYRMRFVAKLDRRAPVKFIIEVEPKDGTIHFDDHGVIGTLQGDKLVAKKKKDGSPAFDLTKTLNESPTLGAKPPAGATVLFDGSGFDAWEPPKGWERVDDNVMMVTPKGDEIVSKDSYEDLQLHIEFRTPFMPRARGQQRGNSGIFIQDVYEVQVLDSYGLEGYYDECGALYKLAPPRVNACRPPLQWQTYDIDYRAPRYDGNNKLTEFGRMTVHHNGVLIHNDQELTYITAWTEKGRNAAPPNKPGHIRLQAHNNYIQFRNIWLIDNSN